MNGQTEVGADGKLFPLLTPTILDLCDLCDVRSAPDFYFEEVDSTFFSVHAVFLQNGRDVLNFELELMSNGISISSA